MTRTIIQASVTQHGYMTIILALCDDGTLWLRNGQHAAWEQIRPIPPEEPPSVLKSP